MKAFAESYFQKFQEALQNFEWENAEKLFQELKRARDEGRTVFLCGNGGSAANALHWANDLTYPITKTQGKPMRAIALTADQSTLTCLANDLGYEEVFRFSLRAMAREGDVLIVMSGSGNSPNVLRALEFARERGMRTFAIVGFDGGRAKGLAEVALHLPVQDMQIAEDFQLFLCHLVLKRFLAEGA